MLVLSRKPGESISIGPDIEIHCVEIRGDVVRLGIVAPKSVKIWRKELLEAVERENVSAAKGAFRGDLGDLLGKLPTDPRGEKE